MTRDRHWTAICLWLLLLAASVAPAYAQADNTVADWRLVQEHWYTVQMAGAKAGWMFSSVHSDGERYRTATEVHLRIGRGSTQTKIELRSSFLETHAGQPLTMRYVGTTGLQPVDSEWRFEEDHVVQITRQGERETRKEQPLPEGMWLTPVAAHRYWLQRHEAGAKQITYRTIDAQNGLDPFEVRREYVGVEEFEFDGRTIPVNVWTTTNSLLPIPALEKYSTDGYLVYEEIRAPLFGKMITRIATKADALAEGGGVELLVKTFIKLKQPIDNAQACTTATLRLHVQEGTMPELPTAGAQRFAAGDDPTTATVTIDINHNQPAGAAEASDASYLEWSAMVDSTDDLIQKLAAGAVRDAGDDPMARAEAMRALVHRHVNVKSLDTAFATASETARMKTGDCSEHAVLLCAMLRAQKVPARVAIGLIYVDSFLGERDIFGWHMWTQALIDGAWVDFDATLPSRYHAAHVLIATARLGDGGLGSELASTLLLMGNLEIDVLDVGYEQAKDPRAPSDQTE
ncbi:MAG: transglutaminase domain-containing protein [Planctomycetes bacterium]|nr:transglutaminase domain-containing protein [Planctomycetota bacterium]